MELRQWLVIAGVFALIVAGDLFAFWVDKRRERREAESCVDGWSKLWKSRIK